MQAAGRGIERANPLSPVWYQPSDSLPTSQNFSGDPPTNVYPHAETVVGETKVAAPID